MPLDRSTSIILSLLIFFASFHNTAASVKAKSVKSMKSVKSAKSYKDSSYDDDHFDQYENEEYRSPSVRADSRNSLLRVTREDGYQVLHMGKNVNRSSSPVSLNAQFQKEIKRFREKERKKKLKESSAKSIFFNGTVESQSDISTVPDEIPKVNPSVTESNVKYSDFTSGKSARLLHHLPVKMGDFSMPPTDDYSDVLAANVRKANMYTSHHLEIDGYMTMSLKEQDIHLWRNPSIHPQLIYNRNNEVDPLVAVYKEDVDTSQKEFESHFGRAIGRDAKRKLMENRNTFSSLNEGCTIC